MVDTLVCTDGNIMKLECMDVTQILVCTRCAVALNDTFRIKIKMEVFTIKMVEDLHAPICINVRNSMDKMSSPGVSSEDGISWGFNNFDEDIE